MTHPAHRRTLSGWDPLRELEDLRMRMDQLMRTTFPSPGVGFPETGTAEAWAPPADVEGRSRKRNARVLSGAAHGASAGSTTA